MIRGALCLSLMVPGAQASYDTWPGKQDVSTADKEDAFTDNMSGVYYDASSSSPSSDVVWSVRNNPSTLYKLMLNSASSLWEAVESKTLHYPDGGGNPDTEDVTKAEASSPNLYTCTERNNDEKGSRLSVLVFRDEEGSSSLNALQEWDLTDDVKEVEDNMGWEAITWVPDTYLVAHGLTDDSRNDDLYDPRNYPDHGSGLFFVGLEGDGKVYGYALTHDSENLFPAASNSTIPGGSSTSSYTRITKFSSQLDGIMSLHFDPMSSTEGYLWALCDDTCDGHSSVLRVSAKEGQFEQIAKYKRPDDMPDINNEGFTTFPESRCDSTTGLKGALWSDDSSTNGHALRQGTVDCGEFIEQ